MVANVDNFFEQTEGGGTDNKLNLGGTVAQGSGGTMTFDGTVNLDGTVAQDSGGDMTLDGTVNLDGTITQDSGGTMTFDGTMVTTVGANLKTKMITVRITDISAIGSVFVVPGFAGTVVKISSVIDGVITLGDAVLDPQIASTSITDGGITIANVGSAAGVVDQSTPSAANVFTASQAIEIATDGGSTDTVAATITLEVLPS